MNQYEEELQKSIEEGQTPDGEGLDVRAYREVFRALKKDPGYELPAGFANRVVGLVMEKRKSVLSKDYFWFGAGIFFMTISFLAAIFFTGFRLDLGFLNVMADYKGLVIFAIFFIVFLNWLDKRLVKDRQAQQR